MLTVMYHAMGIGELKRLLYQKFRKVLEFCFMHLCIAQDVAEEFTEATDQHPARRQAGNLERVLQAASAHC